MPTFLMAPARQRGWTNAGAPAAGCLLYTYAAGTSTPKATYTDAAGLVPHPNPIVLDGKGEALIYWDGNYRIDLRTSAGVAITGYPVDNYETPVMPGTLAASAGGGLVGFLYATVYSAGTVGKWLQDLATSAGAGFIGFAQTSIGAVTRSILVKLRETKTTKDFGAKCDGVTDDTAAINAAATAARVDGFALMISEGTSLVSGTLDFTDITVYGNKYKSKLQATGAQFDVVKTNGNSTLKDFYIHGGWDGSTAGQLGCGIRVYAPALTYPYNVHIEGVIIQFVKETGIKFEIGAYSRIRAPKINACGLHGIHLYALSASLATTTIQIDGMGTSSDCPNGYGLLIEQSVSINVDGLICENTKGVAANGNDNRSITLNQVYQENTIGNMFFTSTGAGIGLSITNCFGAGSKIPELPNWNDVTFYGNSNITESSAPGRIGGSKVIQASSAEVTTTVAGDFTVTSISLPPGSFIVYGAMQTLNAGAGALTRAAISITSNVADSGYNNATNVNYNIGSDTQNYNPGASADMRCQAVTHFSNTGAAAITVYLRGNMALTAGTMAYKGTLTAVKIS